MRIDQISVELRPRSSWEAVELGTALVRTHARAIWIPYVLLTLPTFAALCAVLAWFDQLAVGGHRELVAEAGLRPRAAVRRLARGVRRRAERARNARRAAHVGLALDAGTT